jgi:hypothetical protein
MLVGTQVESMAGMEKVDFRSATPQAIVSTLLHQGSVLLGNFVDTAALGRAYDLMVQVYESGKVERKHVHPEHLRDQGLPMFSDILFTPRHYDVLNTVFGDREYQVSGYTASRRMAFVAKPPHWGLPLSPHLDAFLNSVDFTVNFWIPFQPCGVEAPALGVVLAPFDEIVAYTGYQNGAIVWDDPERFKQLPRFRPAMKALCCDSDPAAIAEMKQQFGDRIRTPAFVPGDAMMLTNWTLHFTHATPEMTKTRENLELRFSTPASLDEILSAHGATVRAESVA